MVDFTRYFFICLIIFLCSPAHLTAETLLTVKDNNLTKCIQATAKEKKWTQPNDFRELKCHSMGIKSLSGLERFNSLESLSLYNNKLHTIDINLQSFGKLNLLNLARNNIHTGIIKNLAVLEKLYLFDNKMGQLQLANLQSLLIFKANNNNLSSLEYTNLPKLTKVYIFNNKLEDVDIKNLPSLLYMDARQNPMPDKLYDDMDAMQSVTILHDGNAEDW